MERDHAYIQLIFPNFYESRFNIAADPLNAKEACAFRRNPTIARNYRQVYDIFLEFLGLRVVDERTGLLRLINNKEVSEEEALKRYGDLTARLRYRLVVCSHNQLRMWRILSALSVSGFRSYA